jgi:hypothetical protein
MEKSTSIYKTLTFIYFETNERNPLQVEEPNREARDQRKSNKPQSTKAKQDYQQNANII